ncbi:MAG: translation elongation factor Ts [Gammaproteobacteria bacterium]|nr:translation elongation factor Ts [Gammaproteobacteria bacterium]
MAAISASMVKELRERTSLGMMDCKKALVAADGNIEQAIEDLRKSSGMKAAKKAGRTAAEGVVCAKVAADGSFGVLVEVNSETDFAARDEGFLAFVTKVTEAAFAAKQDDMAALMTGELTEAREALVQKIGENITPRRIVMLEATNVAAYVHSNNKIGTLIALTAGDSELAKDIAMHVTAVNPRVISRDDMSAAEVESEKSIIKAQPDMAGKPDAIVDKMMTGRINKFLAENSLTEQPFVKNPDQKIGDLLTAVGASVTAFNRLEVGEGIEVEEVDFAAEVAQQLKG